MPVFVSVRAIALAVGRVIDHYKMAKHFTVTITDDALTFTRNAEQIAAEAALDGVYVLRTSLTPETLDAAATVNAYKLDLAVAVAAGVPCLRRFTVPRAGRVLLFAAEDALHIVRRRLEGISAAAGVALANLDIQVITAPIIRLDLDADRRNLAETVARLQPRLLILDPFVRLHRIDENASGEVAPLLAYLRELQRRHDVAVLVVHHAKKGGGGVRAGQALRGSSEFHAWGDSNLYLRRDGDDLSLSVEHRAAPSMTPITIELAQRGTALALEVVDRRDPATPPPSSLDERITATLAGADAALPFAELRACCRVRATTLYERLAVLADTGRVVKTEDGYRLADG